MAAKDSKLIRPLPTELRSIVRAGVAITSVAQCVEELVLNSIDAGAETIFVGVNLEAFNIRVDDDGRGFQEADIESVGTRYATSKCSCLDDLERLKSYGYRGEAVASIVDVSGSLEIITRPKEFPGIELKKKYENGAVSGFVEKQNTSNKKSGTSIIVGKLLSKTPVRQKRIDKTLQLEEIKNCLQKIILMNIHINLSCRNEHNGIQILNYVSSNSYSEAFDNLFKHHIGFDVNFVEEHFRCKRFFFTLSVSRDFCRKKYFQFVFVNNRCIDRSKIHKWIGCGILEKNANESKSGSSKHENYPIFILNITCPFSDYDITLDPKKHTVEFKEWDVVEKGIEGLVGKLKTNYNFGVGITKNPTCQNKNISFASSHDFKRAFHGPPISRDQTRYSIALDSSDTGFFGSREKSCSNNSGKPKFESKRNLTRTGKNSHVVDVRAIRKKSKAKTVTNINLPPLPIPVPKRNSRIECTRPNLIAGALKRFPSWRDELEKEEAPHPQKLRKTTSNETTRQTDPSVQTDNHLTEKMECENDFQWKIQRFFETCGVDAQVENRKRMNTRTDDGENVQQFLTPKTPDHSIGSYNQQKISNDNYDTSSFSASEHEDSLRLLQELTLADENLKSMVENKWNISLKDTKKRLTTKLFSYFERKEKKPKKLKPSTSKSVPVLPITCEQQQQEKVNVREHSQQTFALPRKTVTIEEIPHPQVPCGIHGLNGLFDRRSQEQSTVPNLCEPNSMDFLTVPGFSFDFNKGHESESTNIAPPLSDLFPYQNLNSEDWNDTMMTNSFSATDSDLFPVEWTAEIVLDKDRQEWLKTTDDSNRNLYINLTNGQSSYDMINLIGSSKKVTAEEMKKANPAKFDWLRRHFPKGFKQFWKGGQREVVKHGQNSNVSCSILGETLTKFMQNDESDATRNKWRDNVGENVSEYFPKEEETFHVVNSISKSAAPTDIQCWNRMGNAVNSYRFSRQDFEHVYVIGQYDKKFILASLRKSTSTNPVVVIFDQHAVHERIRLERLILESYQTMGNGKKSLVCLEVVPSYPLNLTESEVRIMQNYEETFLLAGVKFEVVSSTSVRIQSAPKCFFEKCRAEPVAARDEVFRRLIYRFMQEIIHHLIDTKGASLTGLPKTVNEVLCSQACHGAIKFGDHLERSVCIELISQLKSCKNLFQCAHGRPTIVPLITPNDLEKSANSLRPPSPKVPMIDHNETFIQDDCSPYFSHHKLPINLSSIKDISTDTTSGFFSFLEPSLPPPQLDGPFNFSIQQGPSTLPSTSSHLDNLFPFKDTFSSSNLISDNNNEERCPYF